MARIDGRANTALRPVKITRQYLKFAEGSCLIEVGETKVICSASVEEKVPFYRKNTGTGWVTAEYAMLPRSTMERKTRESSIGRVGGRTHEIQRLIGRSLRSITDLAALGERTVSIDCDVIQADGGTRTAAITGAYIALVDSLKQWSPQPVKAAVAAVSVGIVAGEVMLDLCYAEDSIAQVDFNVVMTADGNFVEVQGTAEGQPFSRAKMDKMLNLAEAGIKQLIEVQAQALKG